LPEQLENQEQRPERIAVPHGARLQIQDLSIVYDDAITAVDSVNLEIEPGEFLTLLGPSGSGKTSILMTIAGFVGATSGRVLVDGEELLGLPPNQRNLGMVFQDYALFPHMSVAQNIGFPLKMRGWNSGQIAEAVDGALEMVRLSGYGDRRPTQLSGGEQQRVALARSTVFSPPVLLMDEPLGALDRQLRDHLQGELKRVQSRTGITTLYVTHDQQEAMTLSDRIAVMREGRIEQIGTPAEIYDHPATRFVAGFVGDTNLIRGRLAGSGTDLQFQTETGETYPLPGYRGARPGDGMIDVSIRPERLTLTGDAICSLEATIVDVRLTGEMITIVVETAAGERLRLKEQNRGQAGQLATGSRVRVGWNPEDMVSLCGD
jgi:putative spermidine/putrescine transport system ATP-binding protein